MTAELLREAAALMREVASRANEQTQTEANVEGVWLNSRFHMTWDPAVALAVANWLEHQAAAFDAQMDRQADPERRFTSLWLASAEQQFSDALDVARNYLGGAA